MVAVAELEAGMISKPTKDALAAAQRRGKVLDGNRGAARCRKPPAKRYRRAQQRSDHQSTTGGRENEPESHCRRPSTIRHSHCARVRRVVRGAGYARARAFREEAKAA